MWDQLSLDDKKLVLVDIANVLAQLLSFRFDQIGCVQAPGVVGPLLYRLCSDEGWKEMTGSSGPFQSTIDYLQFFCSLRSDGSEIYTSVKAVLDSYLSIHGCLPPLVPPFRLIHADFDAQNLLFTGGPSSDDGHEPSDTTPVHLSGVLDWEYAFIGPLYYLYEYPIFIQDSDDNKGAYEYNAVLRRHFIRALIHSFPKGSKERADVRLSMDKNYVLKKNKLMSEPRLYISLFSMKTIQHTSNAHCPLPSQVKLQHSQETICTTRS
jgi:Phosphotransferase enzyme family